VQQFQEQIEKQQALQALEKEKLEMKKLALPINPNKKTHNRRKKNSLGELESVSNNFKMNESIISAR